MGKKNNKNKKNKKRKKCYSIEKSLENDKQSAINIVYDHYRETYQLSRQAQQRRNKSFIILCILEAFSFLLLIRPEQVLNLIIDSINSQLDITLTFGNTILQTLLWILIIYVMIRYIQDVFYIERQYSYIGSLEAAMESLMQDAIKESKTLSVNSKLFLRESDNYLTDYPIVLNLIDLFYKTLIPVIFIVINTVRIYNEWAFIRYKMTLAFFCDSVMYVSLFIITWFYYFEIHAKTTAFIKRHVRFVDKTARFLKKLLKNV
ncbi:MAG: hypothetical protein HFH14_03375 [Lachnospiraceae bacterium]|nr:hypothetical protein [Lachnospiraceae bacterium]